MDEATRDKSRFFKDGLPAKKRDRKPKRPATGNGEPAPDDPQKWAHWIRSEADERAVTDGCTFDEAAGLHVVDFFEQFLRHTKGQWAGEPFRLMDWQRDDVILPLFGWKQADGTRRYRTAYIELPKKSGKSAMCAGLSLYLLLADGEPGAEVYNAAVDREQAGIVFGEAANMVDSSPHLKRRLHVVRSRKTIAFPAGRGVYKALSAEVATKEGLNIHGLIFDEFHAQANRQLWEALRYGGAARQQPLFIIITTAGYDRTSICWEKHEYARKVIEGSIQDNSFFAYVAAADAEDDWMSEATWRKANPSLGVTFTVEDMRRAVLEVQNSPANENLFRRYRLNQWTEQDVRFISMVKWEEGAEPLRDLSGRTCFAGLDLATTSDITALVLLFPDADGTYDVLPIFWIPEERAIERERKDGVPYTQWIREGYIRTTRGDMIDYDTIRRDINALIGREGPPYSSYPLIVVSDPKSDYLRRESPPPPPTRLAWDAPKWLEWDGVDRADGDAPEPVDGQEQGAAGLAEAANGTAPGVAGSSYRAAGRARGVTGARDCIASFARDAFPPAYYLSRLTAAFELRELAVDRLFQGAQLATQLADDGFTVVPFGMGFYSMAAPTAELDRLIRSGRVRRPSDADPISANNPDGMTDPLHTNDPRCTNEPLHTNDTVRAIGPFLRHGNNPVLRWMASNVAVETDAAGNLKPSKRKSKEKIDGIVALIMALGRGMVHRPVQPWDGGIDWL